MILMETSKITLQPYLHQKYLYLFDIGGSFIKYIKDYNYLEY